MATAAPQLPADKFDTNMTFVRPDPAPTRATLDQLAVLPGFNTRVKDSEYAEAVTGIQTSIETQGFYDDKPFSVTQIPGDDKIYIFDGEHRFDAARAASLNGTEFPDGLPIAWAKDGATIRDLTVHLVHGNAGRNLNPVEMAAVVRRLQTLGLTKDEIATEIGKTTRHVDNLMVLAGSSQAVKKAVAAGQIAAAEAVKLVRKDPKAAATKIADAVKAAEERGKAKATPKTMAAQAVTGPVRKTIRFEHVADAGTVMADLLKSVAKQIRGEVKFDGNDKVMENFVLNLALSVVDHEAEAAKAARQAEREKAAAERAEAAEKRRVEREAAAAEKAAKKKAADAEKAAKKKAADKAKADAAKAAAAAKVKKAGAAAKVAGAKTQSVQRPSKANGGVGGAPKLTPAQAKAAAQKHLGTTEAKTPAAAKTPKAPRKPVKATPAPKATNPAPDAGKAPDGAATGGDDGMGGL